MVDERQQQLRAESLTRAQNAVLSQGFEFTPEYAAVLDRWAAGDLTSQEADQELLVRTGNSPSPRVQTDSLRVEQQAEPAAPKALHVAPRKGWLRRHLGGRRAS